MAERIAKKMAKKMKLSDIKFSSAGIYATGEQIAENASKVLKKLGYDARARKSVKLKKTKPNIIYVAVTQDHKKFVDAKKVLSFEDLAGKVLDPYGKTEEIYMQTAKQIENNVEILLKKITNLRGDK